MVPLWAECINRARYGHVVDAKIYDRFGDADVFLDSREINNVYRIRAAPRN